MPKMKLNYHEISDRVLFMTKTREDNDIINQTSAIYTKIGTELQLPIRHNAVYLHN